jgi:transposase-like protein
MSTENQTKKSKEPRDERVRVADAAIEELLKDYPLTQEGIFGKDGLIKALTGRVVEKALAGELTYHLGYAKGEARPEESEGNSRNGLTRKGLVTESGEVEIEMPRDREGSFEPVLVRKRQRRVSGLDEKILGLYARGMTLKEIAGFLEDQYGTEVSRELISTVTESVMEEVREWQSRPLERVYPLVILDALWVKMKEEGVVRNQAVYLALGTRVDGSREILGIWVAASEGAKFWMKVMNELKARGVEDILLAIVDGLKGFPEAIRAVYPRTDVQTCIVHLMRASLDYCSWKDRQPVAAELKEIYRALDAEAARERLEAFAAGPWGRKYPMIAANWRRVWEEVIPFYQFGPATRKMVYTSNAIENVNRQLRKIIKNRGHFPSEGAAVKLIYLALRNLTAKWTGPAVNWNQAALEFAIHYGERFSAGRTGRSAAGSTAEINRPS